MDTYRPHAIVPYAELIAERQRERFMPLTAEEHETLAPMTPEQRHEWLKAKLPTKERLARHLDAEGLPDLAYNARQGRYDDFDEGGEEAPKMALLRDLKARARYDLAWIVTTGEYDNTKAESDAWAARQTGEVRELLDAISGRQA